ncbi:MAG: hypothetical protein ABI720_02460 [Actinomycetes bacterium]
MRRQVAVFVGALTLMTTVLANPASAEAPPNDLVENATVIGALPYTIEQDIRGATKSDGELKPKCDRGTRGTVWWTLTAPADGWLVADTKGSKIRTVAAVYSGTPDALTRVACNDDTYREGGNSSKARVYWEATAGTQYYIQVAKDYGKGGDLKLTVAETGPPFTVESFDVDRRGSVDNQTGVATLSGAVTCANGVGRVNISVSITQRIGRLLLSDEARDTFTCEGVHPWQLRFRSDSGLFTGGTVDVTGRVSWQGGTEGSFRLTPTTSQLTGG